MRKYQRHTQAKMFSHIGACRESKQAQKAYCKQHGIAYSTFQYWAKKYRKQVAEIDDSGSSAGFIPLKLQSDPELLPRPSGGNQLHLLYPNGIQVMCPESVHPSVLKNLINP